MKESSFMTLASVRRAGFLFIFHTSTFILVFVAASALSLVVGQSHTQTHRAKKGSLCGNPTVACKTTVDFQSNDLAFRVPRNSVIFDTELFYAVILKSVAAAGDCDTFVPEAQRLEAQALFPDHKVFTSRCPDAGNMFYTNISDQHRIMAVYAGTTIAESRRVLAAVKATGRFPGANLRRMRTGFNGT
jgi:hypothetical protein